MKKLTAEQIQMNWQTLMDIIEKHIGDDRKENLMKFYDDFKERMSAYYSECEALSLQLVDILCKNLGAEPSTLLKIQSDFVDNSSYLRLNYMPPCPFPAPPNAPSDFDESTWGRLSVGRHTDAGSVTILLQDLMCTGLSLSSISVRSNENVGMTKVSTNLNLQDVQITCNSKYIFTMYR
mgnify:CR=1 FL=1